MATPKPPMVDVRDMLCAQALAVVAQALERRQPGEAVDVRYNAIDVRADLLAWAKGLGHSVTEAGPAALRMTRRGER